MEVCCDCQGLYAASSVSSKWSCVGGGGGVGLLYKWSGGVILVIIQWYRLRE